MGSTVVSIALEKLEDLVAVPAKAELLRHVLYNKLSGIPGR